MAKRAKKARRGRRSYPIGSGSHSVVLVHGVLGQGFIYWNLVKRYLSGDNLHFHEVRLPFFGFGDLRKAARHLEKEIDRLLRECADEAYEDRVDIIAHSAGGLVARYYIRRLGGDRKVHSLVTLGTPHYGTYTSALFPLNTVARQTLPGSAFLKDLNDGPDTQEPIHYTCLNSPTDGVVIPAWSARLRGARNVEVKFLTHWGYLWSQDVYRVIREAIDHAPGAYPDYEPAKRPARPRRHERRRPVRRR